MSFICLRMVDLPDSPAPIGPGTQGQQKGPCTKVRMERSRAVWRRIDQRGFQASLQEAMHHDVPSSSSLTSLARRFSSCLMVRSMSRERAVSPSLLFLLPKHMVMRPSTVARVTVATERQEDGLMMGRRNAKRMVESSVYRARRPTTRHQVLGRPGSHRDLGQARSGFCEADGARRVSWPLPFACAPRLVRLLCCHFNVCAASGPVNADAVVGTLYSAGRGVAAGASCSA